MAFEATHVRFARDLKTRLKIQNEIAYYSGCVYPDSRYVTGVSRQSTHAEAPYGVTMSDFEKGQFTHLVYDRVIAKQYLDTTSWKDYPINGFNAAWEQLSGAKLAEDQVSYEVLGGDTVILRSLETPAHPVHDEEMSVLEYYYLRLRNLYEQKPTMEDYYDLLGVFHVPEVSAMQVILAATACLQNTERLATISAIYEHGLIIAKEELNQLTL